jgi:hypothetical protein
MATRRASRGQASPLQQSKRKWSKLACISALGKVIAKEAESPLAQIGLVKREDP